MIIATWFFIVGLIIIAGFVLLGLTFRHWTQQKKLTQVKPEVLTK